MVNSVVYHPCSSRLALRIHLSYFFKLLRALSLSRILVEICLTCIFHHVEKKNLWCSHSEKMHWFPTQNSRQKSFWKSFPFNSRKGWRKLWFALSKFNRKIWRWLGTLGFLYFFWFVMFLNMTALQFWK